MRSGELGLSTGPTRITSKTNPQALPAYGQYVSIWRRAEGGPWKVEADLGIGHAEPLLWNQPLGARRAAAPTVTRGWYLRAWHSEEGGWRIVIDVANPAA